MSFEWTFHDGTTATGPMVHKRYDAPGYFSEILKVEDDHGNVEYDFVHVMVVYENQPEMRYGYTSASYHPTFNIQAGQELTFKGRFFNIDEGEDRWDFGDGSPVQVTHSNPDGFSAEGYVELKHTYDQPGHYFVTFSRTINDGTTSTSHLSIFVNDAVSSVHSTPVTKDPLIKFLSAESFSLDTNYVSLEYVLNEDGEVKIDIFDTNGKMISIREPLMQEKGIHSLEWEIGQPGLQPGIYIIRFTLNNQYLIKKVLLI